MAFKAKLPVAFFCLLLFLGTVSSKERIWRRETDDITGDANDETDVDHKGGEGRKPGPEKAKKPAQEPAPKPEPEPAPKPAPGPGQLTRRESQLSRRTGGIPGPIRNFMNANIGLVKTSIIGDEDKQYAAIWLDTATNTVAFPYNPRVENSGATYTPVPSGDDYACGPPYFQPVHQNIETYLVARIKKKGARYYVHAEEILKHQVEIHDDLQRYARQATIRRILMYSWQHPCQHCGPRLIRICDLLRAAAGLARTFKCDVVYSHTFRADGTKASNQYQQNDPQVAANMRAKGLNVYQLT